jgi:alkanesulfonate monooxygenase
MTQPQCEISWFSALCDDDYEFLGVPDPYLASSWEHCRNIVMRAEEGGFDNVLLPSGYQLGLDTTVFAAAMATQVKRIKLLWATRMGEDWPPQLARRIATLDRILGPNAAGTAGRLNVNIISSDMPGEKIESGPRYARATEIMKIVKTLLNGEHLDFQGEFFNLKLDPARITTISGKCPAFYFGGLSHEARECAAEAADVYLMWPDTMDKVRETVTDMKARAAAKGRTLKFGYRAHVIVRETEDEARPTLTGCCPSWTMKPAVRSARSRSTPRTSASSASRNCAARPMVTGLSRTTCGPGSAGHGRVAGRRLSAHPIRLSPNCGPIRTPGWRPSSCPAIPM